MKLAVIAGSVVGLSVLLCGLPACKTATPGVTNVAGTYVAMIDSAPDKVTNAARKSVEELKFTDVSSTATKVDGKVTARTAQDETVTIDVTQAGENVSKISIRVGATGDQAISNQILSRTKDNLHWF